MSEQGYRSHAKDQDWDDGYDETIDGVHISEGFGLDETAYCLCIQSTDFVSSVYTFSLADAQKILEWRDKAWKYDESSR